MLFMIRNLDKPGRGVNTFIVTDSDMKLAYL